MHTIRDGELRDIEYILSLIEQEMNGGHFLKADHRPLISMMITKGVGVPEGLRWFWLSDDQSLARYETNNGDLIACSGDTLRKMLPKAKVRILECNDKDFCGFYAIKHARDHIELYNIAITKNARRNGYATMLVEEYVEFSKKIGLLTRARCYKKSSWMIDLLKKKGFQEIAHSNSVITLQM